jgi:3-hydroxybutyryl-CoA dehydrogenase
MTIETIGVVGAGTMGSGIAQIAATAGLKVVLIDVTETALTFSTRCP